jgi:hypothetical protein
MTKNVSLKLVRIRRWVLYKNYNVTTGLSNRQLFSRNEKCSGKPEALADCCDNLFK